MTKVDVHNVVFVLYTVGRAPDCRAVADWQNVFVLYTAGRAPDCHAVADWLDGCQRWVVLQHCSVDAVGSALWCLVVCTEICNPCKASCFWLSLTAAVAYTGWAKKVSAYWGALHSKTGRDRSRQLRLWLVERRDRSWFWRLVLDLQCGPDLSIHCIKTCRRSYFFVRVEYRTSHWGKCKQAPVGIKYSID